MKSDHLRVLFVLGLGLLIAWILGLVRWDRAWSAEDLGPESSPVGRAALRASASRYFLSRCGVDPYFSPDASTAATMGPRFPWRWHPPGELEAPILLYHHVVEIDPPSRYAVAPADFEAQMQALQLWGYTPLRMSTLLSALVHGEALPPRPVVITFDDGYLDVYHHAFPVMSRLAFPGVVYLVAEQLETAGFLQKEQLDTLLSAGWEVGNHGMTHSDLTATDVNLEDELITSRSILEQTLGAEVRTFAFPYGRASAFLKERLAEAGYTAGIGVGPSWIHRPGNRFFLSRIEVRGSMDLRDFARLLPYSEPGLVSVLPGSSQFLCNPRID